MALRCQVACGRNARRCCWRGRDREGIEPMKPRTFIRIEPVRGGFDYWVRLYGVNYGGGWAHDAATLGQIISTMLRIDLPRIVAEIEGENAAQFRQKHERLHAVYGRPK